MSVKTNIALVDDHVLLRNGLASLIKSFGDYNIIVEADNGKNFIEKLKGKQLPEVVLMDISMPEMDGYETTSWLKNHNPEVKVLTLSMDNNENSIIRMFKAGAKGYILKDCDPAELKMALHAVATKGFYYNEMVTGTFIRTIKDEDDNSETKRIVQLNDREITFLKLACTELTYKEIADKMFVSPRTVDGYRDALFVKLDVKTRVGLVMYAIKNAIVRL